MMFQMSRASARAASAARGLATAGMRAVQLLEPGGLDKFRSVTLDVPEPGPDQLRIRVAATGVCHRDLLDRQGAFPFMQTPTVLGHEVAGVVDAVGEGADPGMLGRRVVTLHWASCSGCGACGVGETTNCSEPADFLALTANGGYSEYLVAGQTAFVEPPLGWTPSEACSVMCTYGTMYHAALTRGGLKAGETVLVSGASGGVGSAAVQLASLLGARVVGVTSNEDKAQHVLDCGAEEVIIADEHGRFRAPKAVDMAFEAVGGPTLESSLRSLRQGGRVVLIGNVRPSEPFPLKLGLMILNNLSIIGSDSCTKEELEATFKLLDEAGLRPNVDRVLPLSLESVCEAHTAIQERQVRGRVVLSMGERDCWSGCS